MLLSQVGLFLLFTYAPIATKLPRYGFTECENLNFSFVVINVTTYGALRVSAKVSGYVLIV